MTQQARKSTGKQSELILNNTTRPVEPASIFIAGPTGLGHVFQVLDNLLPHVLEAGVLARPEMVKHLAHGRSGLGLGPAIEEEGDFHALDLVKAGGEGSKDFVGYLSDESTSAR